MTDRQHPSDDRRATYTEGARRLRQELRALRVLLVATLIVAVDPPDSPEGVTESGPNDLRRHGYRIECVRSRGASILHALAHISSSEASGIDIVNFYGDREHSLRVTSDAIGGGARTIWFQPGTATDDAIAVAEAAGLTVISERDISAAHRELGLPPPRSET